MCALFGGVNQNMSRHTSKGIIFLTEGSKYDSLRCKGDVKAEGRISADSINIKGSLSADNDITAASSFDFKGRISAGNISAQDVKILTGSDGKAGNITGRKVFIRCGIDPEMKKEFLNITEFILDLFHVDGSRIRQAAEKADSEKNTSPVFTCDEISGDDIELYGVTCSSVSGRNITLKDKCRVDRVICSGKLDADASSVIGSSERA